MPSPEVITMNQWYVKDSIIQDQICRDLELQRLYGKKETIESHILLFREYAVICQVLEDCLNLINGEIKKLVSSS